MSGTREHIDVRISGGVLRVGPLGFPLRTITRATTTEVAPDRLAVVRRYAITVVLGLIPAAAVSAVSPEFVSALVTSAALTWFTARTIRLVRSMKQTRYELVIETATGAHRVLNSDDPHAVAAIAFRVVDAITRRTTNGPRHDDPPNRINRA
ncbi:MAG: DUF6232 family protein [Actinophytocola sp.]|uniref:DUF6232 family protein n=1 Tax=Actinophytocola sp. TaxID=1872138 RepID=UPI003C7516CB